MSSADDRFEKQWLDYILAEGCETCGAAAGVDCDAPELAGLELRRRRQHPRRAAAGSRAYRKVLA